MRNNAMLLRVEQATKGRTLDLSPDMVSLRKQRDRLEARRRAARALPAGARRNAEIARCQAEEIQLRESMDAIGKFLKRHGR